MTSLCDTPDDTPCILPLGTIAAAVLLASCAKLPPGRSAVDDVTVRGAAKVDESEVKDKLATTASPKWLGLFRGAIYDYEIFDRYALERDLARVERFYRARGYYGAHARAGRVIPTSINHVRVEIVVEEGLPVLNDEPAIAGLAGLPSGVAAAVERAVRARLRKGVPFDEDEFKAAESDALRALDSRGYAYAKVTRDANVDIVHRVARSTFTVSPDRPATFGPITIEGLNPRGPKPDEIPEATMRRVIDIKEGQPYSTAAIEAATQALLDLEVFATADVVPYLPDPPPESHVVPLKVRVEPSKLRQLRLGGGLDFDQIKTDLHALVGWEDHNFLGGLRDFTVDFKPGVVLYPTRINNVVAPDRVLPEERLRLQFREPSFIEARTNAFIRPELNVFPLLVKTNPLPSDPVIGYRELKGGIGVDRTLWKFFGSLGYELQIENPFAYKGPLDPALQTLVISYPELITELDLRDDRIHPHKGLYLANDLQIAGGPFFGDATDVRVQPEARVYLPVARKVTFAARASVGFLFPTNYGDVVENHLREPLTDANRALRVRDIETTFFRGLFSGGPSSNRGFPIRGIAPHGVVPFLNPATASQQIALSCEPTPANDFSPDPNTCSIPIGGFTLWELSNELRFAVTGPFSAATFCDMSDVSPRRGNIRLGHLHLSCGAGARYETPVGPIRLDVGYRIQPLQVLGFASEDDVFRNDPTEGVEPKFLGVPLAVAFGIGEAY